MHTGHWPVAATIALSALAFSAIALAQPCYPEFFGRLRADDGAPGDQLGTSIAYSGHALLGAPGDDVFGPRSGSAYIFHQDYEDLRWYSTARPVPRNGQPGAEFGFSVAGTTDRAVIGAPKTDVAFNNDGAASFFIREYSDWSERLVLTASDPHPGSRFGHAVAMTFFSNLRLAIIGAPGTPRNGQPVGVVYISIVEFGWGEVARLEPDDLEPGDVFGS